MTINIAVPYLEPGGQYGFILLADRKVKTGASSDDTDVSDLDNKVILLSKAAVSKKMAATATGKMNLEFEEKPVDMAKVYESVILASLDGKIKDLPFKVLDTSEFSILAAEAGDDEIVLYQVICTGKEQRRNDIARLAGDEPFEGVAFVNGLLECESITWFIPVPTRDQAALISKILYDQLNRARPGRYQGQDIFAVSLEGVVRIE